MDVAPSRSHAFSSSSRTRGTSGMTLSPAPQRTFGSTSTPTAAWRVCGCSARWSRVPNVAELDELPAERAAELLRSCCGASRWVAAMVVRRPFGTLGALLDVADTVWRALGADDWREAFAHHPRIGERTAAVAQDARTAAWSAGEQAA